MTDTNKIIEKQAKQLKQFEDVRILAVKEKTWAEKSRQHISRLHGETYSDGQTDSCNRVIAIIDRLINAMPSRMK